MKKSDMNELRKCITNIESTLEKVYCFYVDGENNVQFEKLFRMSDLEVEPRSRHQDIFKTVLTSALGKKTFPVWLAQQNQDLIALKGQDWNDQDMFAAFRDMVIENFGHNEPYYAVVGRIVYDVPAKGEDHGYQEDGAAVYKAMVFCICPAKMENSSLGVTEDGSIGELIRRWTIKKPEVGFLYPSFDNRGENRNETVLFAKDPSNEHLLQSLFTVREEDAPASPEEQQVRYENLINVMKAPMEAAATISKAVAEKAAENKDDDEITPNMIKFAAAHAGIDVTDFDEKYEACVGKCKLTSQAVVEKNVIFETGDFKLKVPMEKSDLIRTEKVNGINYILVPVDGDVTVNGVSTVLKSKNDVELVNDIDF